jgi:hypothetical protein
MEKGKRKRSDNVRKKGKVLSFPAASTVACPIASFALYTKQIHKTAFLSNRT